VTAARIRSPSPSGSARADGIRGAPHRAPSTPVRAHWSGRARGYPQSRP
jgi:hypothetical protein